MKKYLLIAALLMMGTPVVSAISGANGIQTETASNTRNITVYMIKQVGGNAWSKTPYDAVYDADDNSITVGRFTYTVHENRAYGQENDGRGEFRYVAANYYFNL